jgi:transcriptional regulator with XRE-family HTH domain
MSSEACLKLGRRIRELRKKRGLSQEKLAEKSGITLRHMARLESSAPPAVAFDTLNAIAKALNVSLPSLVTLD